MSVLKWKPEKMRLADLKPSPCNPREIMQRAFAGLEASVSRFGYVEPIVWNKRTGNIVGGHQRHKLLLEKGVEEATVMVVDMDIDDEMGANLTLNNPDVEGDWDDTAQDLINRVNTNDSGLFSALNMDALQKRLEGRKPRMGLDSYSDKNKEIDLDDLDDDTKCPCCGFTFEVGEKDVIVLGADE